MTDTQHPIIPPSELVQQWINAEAGNGAEPLIARAAQWGADQELEACKQAIRDMDWFAVPQSRLDQLQTARRPKPPSLKEQAMELARPAGTEGAHVTFGPEELALIRRALEQLDD
jgi:hypothetical protein